MSHDHEVRHLNNVSRRNLLKASGISLGLTFFGSFNAESAFAATPSVRLAGFSSFADKVRVFKSSKYYLVESDGMPSHNMMIGIKSWQQQVPTPQKYSGTNAWSIPIKPHISPTPISAKGHFLRGAIALAVNGVPIFNALNNRGEDAFLAGELDEWGGHCGRADDYHYHVAPFHLQSIVGKKSPIAYALDGFPIYGESEIDGKKVVGLDSLNGHFDAKKNYHYHGTKTFPYINGGFKGVVSEVSGQVDPQAATKAFRPAGEPLRGASITDFERSSESSYRLTYSINNEKYLINYSITDNSIHMQFTDPQGTTRTEVYQRS